MLNRLRGIQFEGIARCNARCTFCPNTLMTRERGEMRRLLFHKILREGIEFGVKYYLPFLNGEPFLDPNIFYWLDCLQDLGCTTSIYTNASLLDEEKIDRLCKYTHIRDFIISLNAATKETYDKIMRGPSFETVCKNIKYFGTKEKNFRVMVNMVVTNDNIHEARLLSKNIKPLGCAVHCSPFQNFAGAIHDEEERTGEGVPCPAMEKMYVLWDGRVCLCCFDYDGKVILGDLRKQSVKEVWESFQHLRDRHQRLDFDMPLCRDCNVNHHKQRKSWT